MTLWISAVVAAMLVGAIAWLAHRRDLRRDGKHRDTDWGDWPSDQMSL